MYPARESFFLCAQNAQKLTKQIFGGGDIWCKDICLDCEAPLVDVSNVLRQGVSIGNALNSCIKAMDAY